MWYKLLFYIVYIVVVLQSTVVWSIVCTITKIPFLIPTVASLCVWDYNDYIYMLNAN